MTTVFTKLDDAKSDSPSEVTSVRAENTIPEVKISKDTLHIVNVKGSNVDKADKPEPGDRLWYNTLRFWLIFGAVGSLFFVFLSFYDIIFLFLLPLGPLLAWIAWQVRKIARRYDPYKEHNL